MSKLKKGDRVKIRYTGKLKNGSVFDETEENNPLEFMIGEGKILKGLEDAIIGMSPGEKKSITIPAGSA